VIEIDRRGRVAILTLAHGKANAFDLELCEALSVRVAECRQSWCTALVITARGSIFSAGVDLLRVVSDGSAYVTRFLPALSRALEDVFALEKPVVAAVNGHAIAGGCILACAADRRLMARGSGRIGVPELLVGVPFPPVPLEILRFTVSAPRLPELIFAGATLSPDAALEFGLVDLVVDADALVDEALAGAERMAARSDAFATTKRVYRAPALALMRAGRERYDQAVEDVWCAPETIDAIRSYIERTFKKP